MQLSSGCKQWSSYSWEVSSQSTDQDISGLLRNPKVHCRFLETASLDLSYPQPNKSIPIPDILSLLRSVLISPFQRRLSLHTADLNFVYTYSLFHECCVTTHLLLFGLVTSTDYGDSKYAISISIYSTSDPNILFYAVFCLLSLRQHIVSSPHKGKSEVFYSYTWTVTVLDTQTITNIPRIQPTLIYHVNVFLIVCIHT